MSRLGEDGKTGRVAGRLAAVRRWAVVDGNRWLVAGLLTAAVFASTVLVGLYGPVSLQVFLTGGGAGGIGPGAAFVELMKTIVALVTIVLSINQLALSPQLGSVSDQRERLQDSMDLRERAEAVLDEPVSPSEPATFVRDVLRHLGERVERLADLDAGEANDDLEAYADAVVDDVERVLDELEGARFGRFEVVPAVVTFNVTAKIRELRRIRTRHRDALGTEGREAVAGVLDVLELFTTARAYFKVIYVRSEYIGFSRALLYLGAPALVATFWATQLYAPNAFFGTTVGVDNQLWFVAAVTAVSLSPFMLLVSYFSRLATISESTLFIGPFATGDSGSETDV